ncbi:MAG: hypothetical protein H6Q05_964 [Acidobacteria bacterium]|nr:hypothetical protein [Acidobacteriota bacterium]
MAMEQVGRRLRKVTAALDTASIRHAVIGRNAVALWVAEAVGDNLAAGPFWQLVLEGCCPGGDLQILAISLLLLEVGTLPYSKPNRATIPFFFRVFPVPTCKKHLASCCCNGGK